VESQGSQAAIAGRGIWKGGYLDPRATVTEATCDPYSITTNQAAILRFLQYFFAAVRPAANSPQ
jgi:hypothetical protein